MSNYSVFKSQPVSKGHPDKLADQISDAVVEEMREDDSESRIAIETSVKNSIVIAAGEVRPSDYVDLEEMIPEVILNIG